MSKVYKNARARPLFCSLTLLFGGVLVTVVVCLNSLMIIAIWFSFRPLCADSKLQCILSLAPTEGPHLHDWSTNTAEHSASFQISPLEERYHGGQLLGYAIRYVPLGGPNNSEILLEVDVDTRRVNLVNLTEGPTYILTIAGFTSGGEGKQRIYAITCKLPPLKRGGHSMSTIQKYIQSYLLVIYLDLTSIIA